jgi:hypothetical protein
MEVSLSSGLTWSIFQYALRIEWKEEIVPLYDDIQWSLSDSPEEHQQEHV